MPKKNYTTKRRDSKVVNAIFIVMTAAFMLIIPFYRGLFFRINYIPAVIFVSSIFAAYTLYRLRDNTYKVLDNYMDLAVLLIPVAYLISFFFAVNMKDAFDMLLIYCSYFMLYKLTSDLSARDEKYKNVFINVIIASTFILSFTSMLNVAGLISINGAFIGKRLYGLYQYANTTASVLGVGIILSLNKLTNEENAKKASVYQMILTALISSFIFTLSRGGYLVLAGVLLLNFLLVKARAKLKMLIGIFVSFLSSSMLIYKYYSLGEEQLSVVWIYYLISIIVSAIIVYITYSLKNKIKISISDKAINMSLTAIVLVFVGVFIFLFSAKEPIEYRIEHKATEVDSWKYAAIRLYELEPNSEYTLEFDVKTSLESPYSYGIIVRSYNKSDELTEIIKHFEPAGTEFIKKSFKFTTPEDAERVLVLLYNYESDSYTEYKNVVLNDSNNIVVRKMEKLKYVPSTIANRLAEISLETKNASLRVYFSKDGIKILKDYPIAGGGGGAWKNLYRQYQSIPYNTTEVHNFYIQYGIEVGVIGLVVLTGLIFLLIISMLRSIKADSHYLYVYMAAMLLLVHSTIDFNLSLAAVGYMLWMLIGIIDSDKNVALAEKLQHKYIRVLALALSLAIFVASISIYYGMKLGNQAATTLREKKDISNSIELYKKASAFDRYNGVYRIDLAQIMNGQLRKTKDKKYMDEFNRQISLIQKYEPYNHQYTSVMCSMYLAIGNIDEASRLADRKLQDEPLVAQSYMLVIDINYEIAQYYVKDNKIQDAMPHLEKILETNSKLEEVNKTLKQPMKLGEDYPQKVEAASRTLEMIKADLKQ